MLSALRDLFAQHGLDKTYWVAYSGGLDSHVLLTLCNSLRQEYKLNLRVIHINHGLSPQAHHWAAHCKNVCADYAVNYTEQSIQINLQPGDSLEEVAREKRYAVFAAMMYADDVLLTAHHQDDQAETVLLQLLRGAGPKGLAAMPAIKAFAKGYHARPLLKFNRTELKTYAQAQKLQWLEDESNQDLTFARNYIRQKIFPLLTQQWPSAATTIARSARHCAEAQVLLEEFALEVCKNVRGAHESTLSVEKLLQLKPAKQRLVLRSWIQQLGYPIPEARKIEAIQHDVLTAAWDRLPCVSWSEVEIRRYRDDLYLSACLAEHDAQQIFCWDFKQSLDLPGVGMLHAQAVQGLGLRAELNKVSIRYRQGGEVIELPGRGRHTLKNLFNEWNILPWQRDRTPLIYVADKLIAVIGYFINTNYIAKADEAGWDVCLQNHLPLSQK